MELFKDVLAKAMEREEIAVAFPGLKIRAVEIVEMQCYNALQKIKTVIENDSLDDTECFMRIEEIILAIEEAGSNGGSRHDFG